MTDYQKAINERCSRRAFLPKPLEHADQLRERMEIYNQQSGLHMRLVENDQDVMKGISAGYGLFSGVRHFFAMAGKQRELNLNEKAGYWGERLVLDATLLGLGTCWVGGTFHKEICEEKIGLLPDEELVCIILVGEVPKQKTMKEHMVRLAVHHAKKPIDELYTAEDMTVDFLKGMRAVQKAPSALNRQPVHFLYRGRTVFPQVSDPNGIQRVDMGIAMLHFEIGSRSDCQFGEIDGHYMLRM